MVEIVDDCILDNPTKTGVGTYGASGLELLQRVGHDCDVCVCVRLLKL